MIRQLSGVSGLESRPKESRGTLNHGERLPQCLKMSNVAAEVFFPTAKGEMRCGAPVCNGYAGAVAMRAGSAPVGVGPAWPTSVGKREGKTLVGEAGGNLCTSDEPAYGGAYISTAPVGSLCMGVGRAFPSWRVAHTMSCTVRHDMMPARKATTMYTRDLKKGLSSPCRGAGSESSSWCLSWPVSSAACSESDPSTAAACVSFCSSPSSTSLYGAMPVSR